MTDQAAPKRPDSCPSCRSNQPATRLTAYCDEYCGGFIHPCPDPWHKTAAEPAPLTAEENQDDERTNRGRDNRSASLGNSDSGTRSRIDAVAPPLTEAPQPDPLTPSLSLLVKLGSIAVHADELAGPNRHQFDVHALQTLLEDQEINQWVKAMGVFMPVKR